MQNIARDINGLASAAVSPMLIEIKKTSRMSSISLGGVLGINELSDCCIAVSSHLGRIVMRGEDLHLTVYTNRTVEINGKITEVELGYGRT